MKKIFTSLILLMVFYINASAVGISRSGDVITVDFRLNTNVSISNNGNPNWDVFNSVEWNQITSVVVKGTTTADDLNVLTSNKCDNDGLLLDMDSVTISSGNMTDVTLKAPCIVLPRGTAIPETSVYQTGGSKWNSGNKLRYVCAVSSDGKTLNIGGGECSNHNPDAITNHNAQSYLEDPIRQKNIVPFNMLSPNGSITHINASGFLTEQEQHAVQEFNANNAVTTYENGVLTIAKKDFEGSNAKTLREIIAEYCTGQTPETPTKIVLHDGTTWEDGVITSEHPVDNNKKQFFTSAGFNVESIQEILGRFVTRTTIGDSIITTVTTTGVGQLGSQLSNLTQKEIDAVKDAVNLKLVGAYNDDPDMLSLVAKATKVSTLDLSAYTSATMSTSVLPSGWKTKVQKLLLPTSADFTSVPEEFASEFSALRELIIPNNVTTIGRKAFNECTNLAIIDFSDSLKVIGSKAFFKCVSLTELDLKNETPKLWKIDYQAFDGGTTGSDDARSQLHTVTLPATLTDFGNYVFSSTSIKKLDFSECTQLTDFLYSDGTSSSGSSTKTFYYYDSLEEIILPPNLTYLMPGAFDQCNNLKKATIGGEPKYVADTLSNGLFVGAQAFKDLANLDSVIIKGNVTYIGEKCFNGCNNLTTVNFIGEARYNADCELVNRLKIDSLAFKDDGNLVNLHLSNHIVFIGQYSFSQIGVSRVDIPASVEVVEAKAFENCDNLTTVVFEAIDPNCDCVGSDPAKKPVGAATHVGSEGDGGGAFNNCEAIVDVYVNNTTPLVCDNYAFDTGTTWGRGDVSTNFATLHFPDTLLQNYVNVNHYLTNEIAIHPGEFHIWLLEHMRQAVQPHKNGWYEFINVGPMKTDTTVVDTCDAIILRTFSDMKQSYLVPDFLRAYIVNNIEKDTLTGNIALSLQRIFVIPAGTGVILYGRPNAKNIEGKNVLSMMPVFFAKEGYLASYEITANGDTINKVYYDKDHGQPLIRDNWGLLEHEEKNVYGKTDFEMYRNYLVPTLGENVKPYENLDNDKTKPVIYRNFAMGRYTDTKHHAQNPDAMNDGENYVGFFRMIEGVYKAGYAYLRLTGDADENGETPDGFISEYDVADGGEILVKEDNTNDESHGQVPYYYEFDKSNSAFQNARDAEWCVKHNPTHFWWEETGFYWQEKVRSWGNRSATLKNASNMLQFFGELEDNADGIVKLVIPATNNNGDYYTLQGVKVTNPTKGIYIRNGKKVVIK